MKNTPAVAVAPRSLSPLVLACLAATWLVWGSTYLVIRFALVGFAPFYLMAPRFVVAGVLLMGWQLTRGAGVAKRLDRRHIDAGRRHGRHGVCGTNHRVGFG